jgi:[acyl-carrier-protein] S-malonyltransferase
MACRPATAPGLPLALLMPGQGGQYPGMGTGLYRALPAFAAILDEVFEIMGAAGDELRTDWLAADPVLPLDHVLRSQSLLFAIDYALGRLLMGRGLRPAVMLGHSVGELAAATLAGVFDLDDAVRFLQRRGDHLAGAPAGGMAAVAGSPEEVAPHLRPGADIAAINAPRQTVIAGADDPLRATEAALREAGFTVAPVPSLTPFHSTVLEPVIDVIRQVVTPMPMRPPAIALISGYTTRLLSDAEVVDPMYWARHDTDPVLYWPALESLLATGPHLLIECGPGQGLTTLARRHPDVRSGRSRVLSLLGSPARGPRGEAAQFATAISQLLPEPAGHPPRGAVESSYSRERQAR